MVGRSQYPVLTQVLCDYIEPASLLETFGEKVRLLRTTALASASSTMSTLQGSNAVEASKLASPSSYLESVHGDPPDEERHGTAARTPLSIVAEEQVVGELPSVVTQVEDKHKLQDQTNLLPLKQLMVVFIGLSCALFCE